MRKYKAFFTNSKKKVKKIIHFRSIPLPSGRNQGFSPDFFLRMKVRVGSGSQFFFSGHR